jgi:hypothetical protein
MDLFFPRFLHDGFRNNRIFGVALSWVSGYSFGIFLSAYAGELLFSFIRGCISQPVSPIGLLAAVFLPLLFSACSAFCSCFWGVIPIAFLTAFVQGYLGFAIILAFGSAGWLVYLLLVFSSLLSAPALWFFWLRALDRNFRGGLLVSGLLCFVICFADYLFISPFLIGIFSF